MCFAANLLDENISETKEKLRNLRLNSFQQTRAPGRTFRQVFSGFSFTEVKSGVGKAL